MKKILSVVLALVMAASMLAVSVSAATPFGTVIEVEKTSTAPSMADALPDASWGDKIITVNKNTENAAITQYKTKGGKVKQDLSFDLYAKWTEDTLYLCFVSPDPDPMGGIRFWWGDGIQMVIYPGIIDICYLSGEPGWTTKAEFELWDWAVTYDIDDETPGPSEVADGHSTIFWDKTTSSTVVKFAIPFTSVGYSKNSLAKAGDVFSFALVRIDGSTEDPDNEAYVGWLEWGNFYDGSKCWSPNDPSLYAASSQNPATKTANTFKLVDNGATAPAKEEPKQEEPKQETPAVTTEQPSSWAAEEVNAAISLGLVPAELQKSYTTGITRGQLALMLSSLLTKAGVTLPTSGNATFTDTTDANVLAAANLGIINGYKQADGTYMFKPNNTLKRSEMSAIINRVAKLCGKTTTGFEKEVTFTDTASHWCNSELGYPVHMGIVKGTSATTFSPENTLTIEQTVMMVYRTLSALAK